MDYEKGEFYTKEKINKDPFSIKVNSFPKQSQEFIAFLSNMFLEKDVFDKTKKDPKKVERIGEVLNDQGLAENDIAEVLRHFKLSIKEKDILPKDKINEHRRD